jgi:hypothetical protein
MVKNILKTIAKILFVLIVLAFLLSACSTPDASSPTPIVSTPTKSSPIIAPQSVGVRVEEIIIGKSNDDFPHFKAFIDSNNKKILEGDGVWAHAGSIFERNYTVPEINYTNRAKVSLSLSQSGTVFMVTLKIQNKWFAVPLFYIKQVSPEGIMLVVLISIDGPYPTIPLERPPVAPTRTP